MKQTFYILLIFFFGLPYVMGQEVGDQKELKDQVEYTKPGQSQFMIRGYAHAGLEYLEAEDNLSFVGGAFNPLFIYRQSDKLLFESELEFHFEGNDLVLGLEYANISYLLSKNVTLRAGKFFIPFGIFMDRLHPAWINKFPNFPQGFGHDGVIPGTDFGFEVRGAFYGGPFKFNYAAFISNGPQLVISGDNIGKLVYAEFNDNNFNKTFGGRLGVFPLTNSSLEIGFSGNYGKVGSKDTPYEDIAARMFALDLTLIKPARFIKSTIDIKGQASFIDVDDVAYPVPGDVTGTLFFDFENEQYSYYAQFSVRPSYIGSSIIRNLEFNARLSNLDLPGRSPWGFKDDQWDVGINYWLDWRSVFKLTYRIGPEEGAGGHDEGHAEELHGHNTGGNAFFFHWAIGF